MQSERPKSLEHKSAESPETEGMAEAVSKKRKIEAKLKKNLSKNRKKGWRKNVEIEDVEEFIEEERLQLRTGGLVSEKPDDELFVIERKPAVESFIPLKKEGGKKKLKEKLKCYRSLENHSKIEVPIKPNKTRAAAEKYNEHAKETLLRKQEISKKKKLKTSCRQKIEPKNNVYDLWADDAIQEDVDEEIVKHYKRTTNTEPVKIPCYMFQKPSLLAAVEVPHAGTSYNPAYDDHQELLMKANDVEIKKLREQQRLKRALDDKFPTKEEAPKQETWLAEMSQGLHDDSEDSDSGINEESEINFLHKNPPVRGDQRNSGGLTSCDVSQHLAGNVSSCHSSSYSSEQGFISVDELSSNEKVLLMHRIGIQSAVGVNPSNICYHHKMTLLDYFDKLERTCCDPLNVHKKSSRKSPRSINMDMALYLSRQGNKKIKPGQKLCLSCRKKCCLQQNEQEMENEENHSDIPYGTHQTNQDQLSVIFTAVGCSPFKATRVGERDRSSYAKRKLSQMTEKCEELLLPYGLDAGEEKGCKNCNDLDDMVYELKEKCAISPRTMQLQILTLAPPSWTKQKTMEIFEVTKHMARKPENYKKGKVLSETVMQTVENFYQNDEISCLMPGKSDCVSVKIGGEKKHVQKRLLLANIKEIYGEYKLKYPEIRIGFSKFCELRPKWCITVGASGTHSVCVCTIHQNVKLLLAAIPKFDSDYKELLKLMMCDPLSRSCNLHLCDLCPGKQAICTAVETHLKDHGLEMEDDISYTQWVSTDRTQIESCFESLQDFIGEIGVQMETLRAHNFISKSQSSFQGQFKRRNGASSQYKNYKNLQNLLKHKEDFGITAEWQFFATAHGKSPCDGIGGTVKRLARAANTLGITTKSKEKSSNFKAGMYVAAMYDADWYAGIITEKKTSAETKEKTVQENEIFRLKQMKKEITEKEKIIAEKSMKSSKRKADKLYKPARIGKYRYQDPDMEVVLTEELTGSLRQLKPEGHLLEDRFKSFQKRNVLQPSIRQKVKRKYKLKKYVKRGHKVV
ncbi:Ribosome biogenesis protein NOP53 [Nymphon striatum]|nr:Ribosome biogenesis protein NOP53 [Nymphon striatum]